MSVELRHPDPTVERVLSARLVGRDGAQSTARRELGLRFQGDSFDEFAANLRVDWPLPTTSCSRSSIAGNFMTFFPMRRGPHRVAVAYPPRNSLTGDVTIEELQRSLDRCGPPGGRIVEVSQAGQFQTNQRNVDTTARPGLPRRWRGAPQCAVREQ